MITEKPYHKKQKKSEENSSLFQLKEVEIIYSTPIRLSQTIVTTSNEAYNLLIDLFDRRKIEYKEFFYVLLFNRANICLGVAKLSEGGITSTIVDIREIFQLALKTCATSIIISHNHPSGSLRPSNADNTLTSKIREAGRILDIALIDHIILTSNGYYSYADDGKIF